MGPEIGSGIGTDIVRMDASAAGEGADLVRWQTGAPAADPVGEYAAAAAGVLAAFVAPGALDRDFILPEISP